MVLEVILCLITMIQGFMGIRVVRSKKMWESWLLLRFAIIVIIANFVITFFQFTFSYQQYDNNANLGMGHAQGGNMNDPYNPYNPYNPYVNPTQQGYFGHGDVFHIKSTLKDLKESIGMMLFGVLMLTTVCAVSFACSLIAVTYYKFHNIMKEYRSIEKKTPYIHEMIKPGALFHANNPTVPTINTKDAK